MIGNADKAKLEKLRRIRAFAIIAKGDMPEKKDKDVFVVPSQSDAQKTYTVTHNGGWECTCPDFKETGLMCKHIQSVQMWEKLEQETHDDILQLKAEIDSPQCDKCGSYDVVKNGKRKTKSGERQRYLCNDCGHRFSINRVKNHKANAKLIALTMDLYFKGLSTRKIADTVEQFTDVSISHMTVARWIEKFMNKINEYVRKFEPNVGETWNVDEQKVKSNGKWMYAWNILDEKTRFLIANTVTQERSLLETQQVFKKAKKNTNNYTPRMIVSDKMPSYKSVIKNECPDAIHIRAGIKDPINNNKLERFHGTWRERDKVMRGLEQDKTAQAMLEHYRTYYNFIRGHTTLDGDTPAQRAGIDLGLGKNRWVGLLTQSI